MHRADWNFDRIVNAQAQIVAAQNDMTRCLHNAKISEEVRGRMVRLLRSAADDLDKLQLIKD